MKLGLSFDVEDFRQSGTRLVAGRRVRPSRALGQQCDDLLALLDARAVRATFFVVGELLPECVDVVQRIHRAGHEVGLHGFEHRRLDEIAAAKLRDDTARAVAFLERTIDAPVLGYRAPFFSLSRSTLWFVETLRQLGFIYDSSLAPVRRRDVLGVRRDRQVTPFANGLYEVPVTVGSLGGVQVLPFGGGYFRVTPYALVRASVASRLREVDEAVTYFHTYEFHRSRLPRVAPSRRWRALEGWARLLLCWATSGPKPRAKLLRLLDDFEPCPLAQLLPAEVVEARRAEFDGARRARGEAAARVAVASPYDTSDRSPIDPERS